MRGKAGRSPWLLLPAGITPAYAGKSPGCGKPCGKNRDHPRVCGEKSGFCQRSILHLGSPPRMREKCARRHAVQAEVGSPPRMRGKVRKTLLPARQTGITPACAGKSIIILTSNTTGGDHPRVCGEKNACWGVPQTPLGSPPRMRGKAVGTPGISSTGRDHPRVCGEKF